jgi:hypothetical protein
MVAATTLSGTPFIRVRAPSGYIVAKDFAAAALLSHTAVKAITRTYGAILKQELYRRASGRPGPRVREDVYRNRFVVDFVGTNQWQARMRAYNTEPYSDRLEWGFTGFDSLGRYYDQPPFPHFRPAIDAIMPKYEAAIMLAVIKAIETGGRR